MCSAPSPEGILSEGSFVVEPDVMLDVDGWTWTRSLNLDLDLGISRLDRYAGNETLHLGTSYILLILQGDRGGCAAGLD